MSHRITSLAAAAVLVAALIVPSASAAYATEEGETLPSSATAEPTESAVPEGSEAPVDPTTSAEPSESPEPSAVAVEPSETAEVDTGEDVSPSPESSPATEESQSGSESADESSDAPAEFVDPSSRIIITAAEGAADTPNAVTAQAQGALEEPAGETADAAAAASVATQIIDTGDVDVDVESANSLGGESVALQLDSEVEVAQVESLLAQLEADPAIEAAETDRRATASDVTPNDPLFTNQWSLKSSSEFGISAQKAWDTTRGSSSITVAVLDTGSSAHPEVTFTGGSDFISGTEWSGDSSSGWDSDPTDEGDYVPGGQGYPCAASDSSWHGTMVAGVIAAKFNNSVGTAGIAPNVKIQPVRVLGKCGGTLAEIASAIRWASGQKVTGAKPATNPNPAQIINLSLGAWDQSKTCPTYLQSAVNAARSNGSLVVVAAGNEGTSLEYSSPANCDGVVSVAATTSAGTRAYFSNYGTAAKPATVSAPGVGIATTSSSARRGPESSKYNFSSVSGTSFSAPTVSAIAALYMSRYGYGPDTVTKLLKASSTPFPGACGARCTPDRTGSGIVNAARILAIKPGLTQTKPTVSGVTKVGRTLKASVKSWSSGTTYSYRWYRDGVSISGATKSSYKLTKADRGSRVQVAVTGYKAGYGRASVSSSATAKVVGTMAVTTPKIKGATTVGTRLTVSLGKSWGTGVKYSYRWYRSGKTIGGATSKAYRLKDADKGKRISVKVTGKGSGYTTASKKSKNSARVTG